jgi:NAD(P)H dehydrogenase (quinone)
MTMTILVAGATGQIAHPVVRRLAAMGVPSRSLVRDRGRALASLVAPDDASSTEFVELQAGNAVQMDKAFDGVDRVLLSTGVLSAAERDFQRQVIDLSARHSISQIVRIAVLSTSDRSRGLVQRLHAEIESYLAASGVPHTSLRPALFQSTLLSFAPEIRDHGVWVSSAPTARNPFVHPEDVSDAALAALLNPGFQNKTYELMGPQLLTYREVADLFAAELGRPVRYVALPVAQHRMILMQRGLSPQLIDLLLSRDEAGEAGENARLTDHVQALTGHPPRSLAGFLHGARSAFLTAPETL